MPGPTPPARINGTVKWYNETLGYGFIVSESGEDHFVHARSVVVERPLEKGELVQFVSIATEKGARAIEVHPSSPHSGEPRVTPPADVDRAPPATTPMSRIIARLLGSKAPHAQTS